MNVCKLINDRLVFKCPGCAELNGCSEHEFYHSIDARRWNWNNSLEKPTLSPSVRHYELHGDQTEKTTCHYFIKDGNIHYCEDSPHGLAGKTVPLPNIESDV